MPPRRPRPRTPSRRARPAAPALTGLLRAGQRAVIADLEAEHMDGRDPHGPARPGELTGRVDHLQGGGDGARPGLPSEHRARLDRTLEDDRLDVRVPGRPLV